MIDLSKIKFRKTEDEFLNGTFLRGGVVVDAVKVADRECYDDEQDDMKREIVFSIWRSIYGEIHEDLLQIMHASTSEWLRTESSSGRFFDDKRIHSLDMLHDLEEKLRSAYQVDTKRMQISETKYIK